MSKNTGIIDEPSPPKVLADHDRFRSAETLFLVCEGPPLQGGYIEHLKESRGYGSDVNLFRSRSARFSEGLQVISRQNVECAAQSRSENKEAVEGLRN